MVGGRMWGRGGYSVRCRVGVVGVGTGVKYE